MFNFTTDLILKTENAIPVIIQKANLGIIDAILSNLPFIITMLTVITAATVTYRTNRKSVESQNDLATKAKAADHENKISEFRHFWLQEVRNTASELIKLIHECQLLALQYTVDNESLKSARKANADTSSIEASITVHYEDFTKKRAELYKQHAKLKLFFKKDDPNTILLFPFIQQKIDDLDKPEITSLDNKAIEEIVEQLQVILKEEWEVTKERKWLKKI